MTRILTLIAVLLLAVQAVAHDQKVLDFCHEYIGEHIKPKQPDYSYMIPIPQNQMRELVQPFYRGQPTFSQYSTYPIRGAK